MKACVIVERVALVALPVVALVALLFLGGSVDPCLAPSPACGVHEGVSPWLIVVPAAILWSLALVDIGRGRRRVRRRGRRRVRRRVAKAPNSTHGATGQRRGVWSPRTGAKPGPKPGPGCYLARTEQRIGS